jgi:hypothetical protein
MTAVMDRNDLYQFYFFERMRGKRKESFDFCERLILIRSYCKPYPSDFANSKWLMDRNGYINLFMVIDKLFVFCDKFSDVSELVTSDVWVHTIKPYIWVYFEIK